MLIGSLTNAFILVHSNFFFLQLGSQGTRVSWQEPRQPRAAGSAQFNVIGRKAVPLR